MTDILNPEDYIITRKRKKYKFALYHNSPLCFEYDEWEGADFTPTVLEVGAGTGLFGTELAKRMPEEKFVEFDVKGDRLITGARKAEEDNVKNIRFLRARADQLPELIAPRSLRQIWVTFPDPFPKDRAAKHRLTHQRYLAVYQQLLAENGALFFKTDNHDLFTWSLEELVRNGWQINELSFDLHESDLSDDYKIMTSYEKRFTSEGLPTHFVKAHKE